MAAPTDTSVDVVLRTTADSAGAQQIERDLDQVKAKADAASGGAGGEARETFALSEAAQGRLSAEERIASIIAQRQILVDLELEKSQALLAGETERAVTIGNEIELRTQALRLQTSAQLTEDEAFAIAQSRLNVERQIAFQKQLQATASVEGNAANIFAGASLSKARNEATILARELATGANTSRTIGSLVGALGPAIGIAGLGAYLLYENFDKVEKVLQGIADTIYQIDSAAVVKQITAAHDLAAEIGKAEHETYEQLNADIAKLTRELEQLSDKRREAIVAGDDKGAAKITEQIGAQEQILRLKQAEIGLALIEKTENEAKTAELKRHEEQLKKNLELQKQGVELDKEFRKVRDEGLSDDQKLSNYKARIQEIGGALGRLGIAAATPNEAYQKSIGLADAERNSILRLAIEWQKLTADQGNLNDKLAEEAKKRGEVAQKIKEEMAALQLKQKDLQLEFQLTTDPAKKAAIQEELEQLNLKLLVEQKVKDAADAAGRAGQEWTNKNSEALRNQLTPALERELSIMQKLAQADPTGGWQAKIDAMVGAVNKMNATIAKAPSGDIADRWSQPSPDLFGKSPSLFPGGPDQNQNQQSIEALKTALKQAHADVAKSLGDIATASSDGLSQIQIAAESIPGKITPMFEKPATAISTEIPAAIDQGLQGMTAASNRAIATLKASFDRQIKAIESQINALWGAVS